MKKVLVVIAVITVLILSYSLAYGYSKDLFDRLKTMSFHLILDYLPIMLTGLVAIFTGLYWWNARRAFLLELDRVVLWFRLEESKKEKSIESKIEKIRIRLTEDFDISDNDKKELIRTMRKKFEEREFTREMTKDLAFFRTLKSRKLRYRLRDYEKEKIELAKGNK